MTPGEHEFDALIDDQLIHLLFIFGWAGDNCLNYYCLTTIIT